MTKQLTRPAVPVPSTAHLDRLDWIRAMRMTERAGGDPDDADAVLHVAEAVGLNTTDAADDDLDAAFDDDLDLSDFTVVR